MKPLETHYAGCRFRSRLEARWAVLFDHLGLRWQYEPQGYEIAGRPYLPDFHLTDTGLWVEVKGTEDELDQELMTLAGGLLPGNGLLTLGPIPDPGRPGDWDWAWQRLTASPPDPEGNRHLYADWVAFGAYPTLGLIREARETSTAPPFLAGGDAQWLAPVHEATGPSCVGAYAAARSARFEHGADARPDCPHSRGRAVEEEIDEDGRMVQIRECLKCGEVVERTTAPLDEDTRAEANGILADLADKLEAERLNPTPRAPGGGGEP